MRGNRVIDLTGKRFGRLTVVGFTCIDPTSGQAKWECRCDCGSTRFVFGANLRRGTTRGCRCQLAIDPPRLRHGSARKGNISGEWRSWRSMRQRCLDPNATGFERYGGAGIKICERWLHSFEDFLADMGPRPSLAHTIDRYPKPTGDYEPDNCRWATKQEQRDNRR